MSANTAMKMLTPIVRATAQRGRSMARAAGSKPSTNSVRQFQTSPSPESGSQEERNDYERVIRSMSPSASVRHYGTSLSGDHLDSPTYNTPFRHQHVQDPSNPSLSFQEDYDEWNLYDAPASVTRSDLGQYGVMMGLSPDPYGDEEIMPLTYDDDSATDFSAPIVTNEQPE